MFKTHFFLVLFTASSVYCNVTYNCTQGDICISYLDIAAEMITKAKYNPSCNYSNLLFKVSDCADVFHMGNNKSGVYKIWPMNRVTEDKHLFVYCDMVTDGGGWTVIQRRGDFLRPKDYFYKDWRSYKEGFGDIEKDFWLGNDNIFALTNQKIYSVRFDLKDINHEKRYSLYDKFWTDDENHKYTLHISDYSGNAGDSMIPLQNNKKFTTKDQDNDTHNKVNCAVVHKGAWWYERCHHSNLNGIYYKGRHNSYADGVNWDTWKGYHESLEWTEIKIRPKNFFTSQATPS